MPESSAERRGPVSAFTPRGRGSSASARIRRSIRRRPRDRGAPSHALRTEGSEDGRSREAEPAARVFVRRGRLARIGEPSGDLRGILSVFERFEEPEVFDRNDGGPFVRQLDTLVPADPGEEVFGEPCGDRHG